MRIAILSDTHANERTVTAALDILRDRPVECLLHCGDIDDAGTVFLFEGLPTHFVLGNCDFDEIGIMLAAKQTGATLHGRFAALEFAGKKIALIHGDDQRRMEEEISSGRHDFLFHGHTHLAAERREGPTRVINPGALHRASRKTFVILDTDTEQIEFIEVAVTHGK